jgi:hypothetical protein
MRWFLERLWLLVILAFVVLIAAWVTLFTLAGRNTPEFVDTQPPPPARSP